MNNEKYVLIVTPLGEESSALFTMEEALRQYEELLEDIDTVSEEDSVDYSVKIYRVEEVKL